MKGALLLVLLSPRVAFLSEAPGEERAALCVMDADGGGLRELVAPAKDVIHFACSPRGGRLAYVCDPEGDEMFRLVVLDAATGREEDVPSGIRWYPVWSPDGKRLAFMQYGFTWRIRVTAAGSLDSELLGDEARVPADGRRARDGAPTWSPDGKRIAFQSNRHGKLAIWVGSVGGKGVRRLTETPEAETRPRFSPDGRWIAYLRARDLWVMRGDGTEPRNLSRHDAKDGDFEWSPDGARIAFTSERHGKPEVLAVEVLTWKIANLSRHAASDRSPAWSPDGRRLLFVSDRDGDEEVYVMDADGARQERLTRRRSRDYAPAWLPARD